MPADVRLPPDPLSAELASMLEHIPGPAILLSPQYEIRATNSRYRERYGALPAQERRCFAVSHHYASPCDQNGEACPLQACRRTRQPSRVAHVHHTPHGPEHCNIVMHPLFGEDGEISAFVEQIIPIEIAHAVPEAGGMLGRSRAFSRALELMDRVAPTDTPVLLLGETGTGKELAARAIHQRSHRQEAPFVPIECSGLSASLFESELFGHERGAFTGADRQRDGLISAASGGTLFLDEIGDLPLGLQIKLLRLLESGTYRRVGGTEPLHANFRLICATWRSLRDMVQEGTFRRDLFYRISVFPVPLPPLRDRPEDIALIVEGLLHHRLPRRQLRPEALTALQRHAFPGNVRELRNIIDRAVLLADGPWIEVEHLPPELLSGEEGAPGPASRQGPWPWGEQVLPLDEVERRYLEWVRDHVGEGRRDLAQRLGISERTLYRKLRQGGGEEEPLARARDGEEPGA